MYREPVPTENNTAAPGTSEDTTRLQDVTVTQRRQVTTTSREETRIQERGAVTEENRNRERLISRSDRMQTRNSVEARREQFRAAIDSELRAYVGIDEVPIQTLSATTSVPLVAQTSTTQLFGRPSTINEPAARQQRRRQPVLISQNVNNRGSLRTARVVYEAAYRRLDNSGATGVEQLQLQLELQRAFSELIREERDQWF